MPLSDLQRWAGLLQGGGLDTQALGCVHVHAAQDTRRRLMDSARGSQQGGHGAEGGQPHAVAHGRRRYGNCVLERVVISYAVLGCLLFWSLSRTVVPGGTGGGTGSESTTLMVVIRCVEQHFLRCRCRLCTTQGDGQRGHGGVVAVGGNR